MLKQSKRESGEHPVSTPLLGGFSIESAISHHLDLHSSHWRPGTYRHHVHRLIPFLRFLTTTNRPHLSDITVSVWSEYVLIRQVSISETTLHHDSQVLRLFCGKQSRTGFGSRPFRDEQSQVDRRAVVCQEEESDLRGKGKRGQDTPQS